MHLLESESILAIKWFKDNKMIVNPGKFQVKKKNNYAQEVKKIGNKVVKVTSSVKRLSVHIDVKLEFSLHIANICRSAAHQINAFKKVFEDKKVLITSYFYPNFNYCLVDWMFSHAKSLNKVEALQKRTLRILYDD